MLFGLLFELNRRMPNGTYGGVRGERKSPLLDYEDYKNNETAQYTSNKAMIRFTVFGYLAKNLQKMEPNNAHT